MILPWCNAASKRLAADPQKPVYRRTSLLARLTSMICAELQYELSDQRCVLGPRPASWIHFEPLSHQEASTIGNPSTKWFAVAPPQRKGKRHYHIDLVIIVAQHRLCCRSEHCFLVAKQDFPNSDDLMDALPHTITIVRRPRLPTMC